MKLILLGCLVFPVLLNAQISNAIDKETIKKQIIAMEKAFESELLSKGAAEAFYKYAADNAVIKRENDTLVIGKDAIKKYYSNPAYAKAKAWWSPDFIDVSEDGTMAYTYGNYKWDMTDDSGNKQNYTGVFHTVWKKMSDGSWKYVWD